MSLSNLSGTSKVTALLNICPHQSGVGETVPKEMGKRKLGTRGVGVISIDLSKANKMIIPVTESGRRETGTNLNKTVFKETGLTEATPEESSVTEMDLKDTHIDDSSAKGGGHVPVPASVAFPITPPYPGRGDDWACGVDYNRREYTIRWAGDWQCPSLLSFPNIQDLTIHEVHQSDEKRRCWQHSTMLEYGSYAYIRIFDEPSLYSVLKIAHRGDAKRQFISREFEILKLLNTQPVVRVHEEPLSDQDGLFGFQMQELYKINTSELAKRLDELEYAIKKVHEAGIAINDVSISNVMLDAQNRITLVDFGFAGHIGEEFPSCFPSWKSLGEFFSVETDNKAFHEICNLYKDST